MVAGRHNERGAMKSSKYGRRQVDGRNDDLGDNAESEKSRKGVRAVMRVNACVYRIFYELYVKIASSLLPSLVNAFWSERLL